mmetsp:Transcript_72111/g.136144  ORF Transcript_72111/g.136144 Transcript_72111/m.136144 type:complete len:357 (-) Transcript_72111:32-1102(-)
MGCTSFGHGIRRVRSNSFLKLEVCEEEIRDSKRDSSLRRGLSSIHELPLNSEEVSERRMVMLDVVLLGSNAGIAAERTTTPAQNPNDMPVLDPCDNLQQARVRCLRLKGASHGLKDLRASVGSDHYELGMAALKFLDDKPAQPRSSLGSVGSSSTDAGRLTVPRFKRVFETGPHVVTMNFWPVERGIDLMPTFPAAKQSSTGYIGLMSVDKDVEHLDDEWSQLEQRLAEARYHFTRNSGYSQTTYSSQTSSRLNLACVPLRRKNSMLRQSSKNSDEKDLSRQSSKNSSPFTDVPTYSSECKELAVLLNAYVQGCDRLGLVDLTRGGGPVDLWDEESLFHMLGYRAAEWLLTHMELD